MGSMMQSLKILNKKEIKKISALLKRQFGFEKSLGYVFLMNNKSRIFLITGAISGIDMANLRINSLGLYFGEISSSQIRLSIEGSQLIGKDSKNIIELDEKEAKEWLGGIDISKKIDSRGFVLLRHKRDFLGCGKAVDNKILNYVPKNRRLRASS
ncbi:hypothetical protein GF323_07205 [Candidatus Woesearchaeota archaeon]|nr:hypothetical protein [Candidatus Woesearchaeota archaeon]